MIRSDDNSSRLFRREVMALVGAGFLVPNSALAASPTEITWDDLLPPDVPYSEIVGEGDYDEENDTWSPVYDDNATKLNKDLDGAYIRMPGYIVPLEMDGTGVTQFLLVPYVGACIHVPPPPANQLVYVTAEKPWPSDGLWDPVWVVGEMKTQLQSTDLGQTGYLLNADKMEIYEW